jgi:hypothetical protein
VTSNTSYTLWIDGRAKGAYELDVEFINYREQLSLQESPSARAQSVLS